MAASSGVALAPSQVPFFRSWVAVCRVPSRGRRGRTNDAVCVRMWRGGPAKTTRAEQRERRTARRQPGTLPHTFHNRAPSAVRSLRGVKWCRRRWMGASRLSGRAEGRRLSASDGDRRDRCWTIDAYLQHPGAVQTPTPSSGQSPDPRCLHPPWLDAARCRRVHG